MPSDTSPSILILAAMVGLAGLILTTIFHYKSLALISRHYVNHRFSIGSFEFVMCAALGIHIIEIVNFGLLMALGDKLGLGSISGAKESYVGDYIYYAAITYTSVGYGDLAPTGGMRALAVIVALAGLMLVSLSGAFIAGLLSRHDDNDSAARMAAEHRRGDHSASILDKEINFAKQEVGAAKAEVKLVAEHARRFAEDHGLIKPHDPAAPPAQPDGASSGHGKPRTDPSKTDV